MKRTLGFVTSARSDFGLLLPLIRQAEADPAFDTVIFATGMHFSAAHGASLSEIQASNLTSRIIQLPIIPDGEGKEATADAMGREVSAFAQAFAGLRPDLLVVLGDRYDMIPAVIAALPMTIPVAHISGGELTEGVIDDSIRHAVTKMSHLHFPAMEEYAARLQRMGEEPWRIHVTGEPGLDVIASFPYSPRSQVFADLGLRENQPLTIFTLHPENVSEAGNGEAIHTVLDAADSVDSQIVLTYPNSDPGSAGIIEAIEAFASSRPHCVVFPSLGRNRYLNVLKQADAMVGNSSSGIVEAASFRLPVINLGDRQQGRMAPANVLNVPFERQAIVSAWRKALSADFRQELAGIKNPYGDGHAVERILSVLRTAELGAPLTRKRFHDELSGSPAR